MIVELIFASLMNAVNLAMLIDDAHDADRVDLTKNVGPN
jgi:hypothetical protein